MRLKQLDLLRGIAILLVLGRHPVVMPDQAGIFQPLADLWLRFGWTGVDLFFVLSGFLIGGLLFDEIRNTGNLDVRRFIVRRGFKIWPAYYVLILFMLVAAPMSRSDEPLDFAGRISALIPHFVHIQNYIVTLKLHTWSLAIEEHFYLILPLVLLVLIRFHRDPSRLFYSVVTLAILIAACCLAMRLTSSAATFSDKLNPTHLRIDSLFFGVLLASIYRLRPAWFTKLTEYRPVMTVAGLLLIAPMVLFRIEDSAFVVTWGLTLLYLGYGCLLVAAMSSGDGMSRPMAARALVFIGVSSYSVYLWHWHLSGILKVAAHDILQDLPTIKWGLFTFVYILAATGFGYLMNKLVEAPALRFRDRFFPSRVTLPHATIQSSPSLSQASSHATPVSLSS